MEIKKKVLFVEDDTYLIETAKYALEKAGFDVISVADGAEVLPVAFEQHPDIILLDVELPNKSGVEILRDLRKDEWGKDAKVIILTNHGDMENVAGSLQYGALEFLMKVDWNLESLIKKIRNYLDMSDTPQQSES